MKAFIEAKDSFRTRTFESPCTRSLSSVRRTASSCMSKAYTRPSLPTASASIAVSCPAPQVASTAVSPLSMYDSVTDMASAVVFVIRLFFAIISFPLIQCILRSCTENPASLASLYAA